MQHVTDTRRPYKLVTAADGIEYGHYPAYPVGPAMVTNDNWHVSITTTDAEPGAVSGVFKILSMQPWETQPHELDKVTFPDVEAAYKAQYEAGVLAYMVYDDSKWANA